MFLHLGSNFSSIIFQKKYCQPVLAKLFRQDWAGQNCVCAGGDGQVPLD